MAKMQIYWGNRLEKMAGEMFDSLYGGETTFDPMVPRCIVTHSPVMQAWLKHYFVFEWSGRRGRVLANCDFELLYPFVNDWMDRLLSEHEDQTKRNASNHPYSITNLQWRIYRLMVDGKLDGDTFKTISSYLGDESSPRRQFQLAGKLATMFDEYQIYRHDVISAWQTDGNSGDWQGELWRLLVNENSNSYADLFSKMNDVSKENLKTSFNMKYKQVAIFGTTSMPLPYIHFLNEVFIKIVDVDLFVLNPGQGYWLEDVSRIKQEKLKDRLSLEAPELIDDPLALPEKGHELLCSMGTALQDYLFALNDHSNSIDDSLFSEPSADTLLSSLQSEILNTEDSNTDKPKTSDVDDSIQVHICHSARREVEVLHDHLLKWLTHDESNLLKLQPYQIQVMVTDMSAYAPHIDAIFSSSTNHSSSEVPYAIDARTSAADSEILSAFMSVCNIVTSRFQLGTIIDLLANEAVLKAFNLTLDDLDTIEQIAKEGNIRWGLDAEHRQALTEVSMSPYMTWEYGLDRLLMGYATGETDWHDDLYTSDYAEGGNAAVLGKLTKFIYKLKSNVAEISATNERSLYDWHELFAKMLDTFFVSTENSHQEITRIRRSIDGLKQIKGMKEIPFEVVIAHLEKDLSSTTTGDNLLANSVVFCQLRPMNSRPAEITCVLGLNDGTFPRNDNRPTFDLLSATRRRGDRSLRSDDRCAFLESLINARRKLYLSFTGRTDKSNEVVPPSIVLQELKDYLKNRCGESELIDGKIPFETLHHLNAIHPDYFDEKNKLFSYSKADFLAAKQLTSRKLSKDETSSVATLPRETTSQTEIELDDLKTFFKNPAKYFYKNIMDIRLEIKKSLLPDDDEPMKSDTLESYKLKLSIIKELNGVAELDADAMTNVAEAEGHIPLGSAGADVIPNTIDQIREWLDSDFTFKKQACGTVAKTLKLADAEAKAADITITPSNNLPTIIRGAYRVFPLENGTANIQLFYRPTSRKTKDEIDGWISHLFACSQTKDCSPYTVVLGMDRGKPTYECYDPRSQEEATRQLEVLIDMYHKGQEAPLPFAPETSLEYFKSLRKAKALKAPSQSQITEAEQVATKKWGARKTGKFGISESQDDSLFHAFGELGPVWSDNKMNTGFGENSLKFFEPMLEPSESKGVS